MASFGKKQSHTFTEVLESSHIYYKKGSLGQGLKDFWYRKSIFKPHDALPETFAARRHIPGANVPKVEIVHSNPRWLLLQAPKARPIFFQMLNKGRLGCKEEQVLKIFRSFTYLIKQFGFFRPTWRMIFLEKMEAKVWIH